MDTQTTTNAISQADWQRRFAERMTAAGVDGDFAVRSAVASLESIDAGDELLEDPGRAADEELSYWSDDGDD